MATDRTAEMYDGVPSIVKDGGLVGALAWGARKLMELEGAGHVFEVAAADGPHGSKMVVCEFAKPDWAGSHVGGPMPTGSEAVVMAICEYLVEQEGASG